MVQLHLKRGDESQFLFSTTVDTPLETVIQQITAIYNGRLKVDRLCSGKNEIDGTVCVGLTRAALTPLTQLNYCLLLKHY